LRKVWRLLVAAFNAALPNLCFVKTVAERLSGQARAGLALSPQDRRVHFLGHLVAKPGARRLLRALYETFHDYARKERPVL